jgi:hypothetical protein
MIAMAVARSIDPKPLVDFIKNQGGECSFDDGVHFLSATGLSENEALDALWRLLSWGDVAFTPDRRLRLPHPAQEKVAV